MYIFVNYEKIAMFFLKYNIDFTLFTNYEQSVLIVLCNILTLLFYIFMFIVIWKVIFKIIDWFDFR